MVKAIVIKSTESSKGGFVTTLEFRKQVKCPITGETLDVKTRKQIKTPVEATEGLEVELDMANFSQREYSNTLEDGTVLTSTYLHHKVA